MNTSCFLTISYLKLSKEVGKLGGGGGGGDVKKTSIVEQAHVYLNWVLIGALLFS